MKRTKTLGAMAFGLVGLAATGSAETLTVHGVASGRAYVTEGQPPWIEGGFGRLTEGAEAAEQTGKGLRGQLHLGLDLKLSEVVRLHAAGVLQGQPSSARGQRAGLVEALLEYRPELSPRTSLRFRAGLFFPPTSLENSERLWQSPYTITLSALNTWIGEEARFVGVDSEITRKLGGDQRLDLAGAVFGANDTSGALIAWRGWDFGDRLTTFRETLPLPPLKSIGPDGFDDQRTDGTVPIDELDNRLGWHLRARWSRPGRALVQAAVTDSRGDRAVHRGQYAWATRFGQAGTEVHLGASLTLVAEGALGDTGMGPDKPGGVHVDTRFRVGYLLGSWVRQSLRLSARVDGFKNEDRDGTAEPDQESGWAFTAAAFWQVRPFLRFGMEYITVNASRLAAGYSGADPNTDARRGLVEVRLQF